MSKTYDRQIWPNVIIRSGQYYYIVVKNKSGESVLLCDIQFITPSDAESYYSAYMFCKSGSWPDVEIVKDLIL